VLEPRTFQIYVDALRDFKLPPRSRETNAPFLAILSLKVGKKISTTHCFMTQKRANLGYVDAVVINKIQYNFKASLNPYPANVENMVSS
jgi:hypothetical protein